MATVTFFYQSVHNLKKFIAAFTSTASLGLNPSHRCHRACARRRRHHSRFFSTLPVPNPRKHAG